MFEYSKKTENVAISIMDAIFSKCEVEEEEKQVLCFTSIYISAKMNEKEGSIPSVSDILSKY